MPAPPRGRAVRSRVAAPLALGAIVLGATTLLAVVDPNAPGHYPMCPLLALTGLACPACGALRATHDLARLDVVAAWAMNPLWVLVAPVLALAWARWLVRSWRGDPSRPLPGWVAWASGAVLVLYGVLRNVPALTPWLGPPPA